MGFVKDFSGEMVGFSRRKDARLIGRMGKIVLFVLMDWEKRVAMTSF